MSSDVSSLANTGVIVIRNTIWAKQFLEKWLSLANDGSLDLGTQSITDQIGLQALISQLSERERQRVAVLPPHVLNSDVPAFALQAAHHQVRLE